MMPRCARGTTAPEARGNTVPEARRNFGAGACPTRERRGARNTGSVCVSNDRMAVLEDLQFTLGEGPCQDAFRTGLPVLSPNLGSDPSQRWPSFIERAAAAGVGAVFAYPLQTGHSKVGVLTI